MALDYIIRRVAADAGISSPDLNTEQKAALIDIINEAAKQIYEQQDLPIVLQEVYVKVQNDTEISLPTFVGELRAVRHACEGIFFNDIWTLHDMRPRYTQTAWKNNWKSWRIKGYNPVASEVLNTAPGTVVVPAADSDLVVTFMGETIDSNRAIESVTMDATSKAWTNNYTSFKRIGKNKVTDYNVVIKDADGNEIAIIYADQLEARYMVVDISKYPNVSMCTCDDGSFIMEVLFKPRLPRMELDSDIFPVDGYDDVIVLKTKQLIAESQEGKEDRAILMDQKATRLINQIGNNKDGTTQRKMTFKRNGLWGLFSRYRHKNYPNRYYADYIDLSR